MPGAKALGGRSQLPYFTAFLCEAQRFRCASAMRLRPSALIALLRRGVDLAFAGVNELAAERSERACLRREISASIEERRLSRFIGTSVSRPSNGLFCRASHSYLNPRDYWSEYFALDGQTGCLIVRFPSDIYRQHLLVRNTRSLACIVLERCM